jgi:MFS family permease
MLRRKAPVGAQKTLRGVWVQVSGSDGTRSRSTAWIVLGMLGFVYVLNFLDRQLLAILAKPIQDTLHISDHQLGLIGGLYFALFYCFIAIPVGWLADKTNRVKVLSLSCAIWSAATLGCGLATSYPQLVVARMTVGFGEAGGAPLPTRSLRTTLHPPVAERHWASSI